MMDLDEGYRAVEAALTAARVPLLTSEGALEPRDGAGRILLRLDEFGVAALTTLINAVHPGAAVLTPASDEGFAVHLLGTPWVVADFLTEKGLDSDDKEDDSAESAAALQVRLERASAAVVAHTPVGPHGNVQWVRDELYRQVSATGPVPEGVAALVAFTDHAADTYATLKQAHARAMLHDAAAWAARVAETEPVPPGARRTACLEVAYRFMRSIDQRCTTRANTQMIADELVKLVAIRP